MMPPEPLSNSWTARTLWPWWLLLCLSLGVYGFGLGGKNIPSNGDEMVYAHIARLTAESGHWLPLRSELIDMRNTKPPLLFWQAMVVGQWGQSWTLWHLRLPSLVYTLLIAAAVLRVAWGISRNKQTALAAAAMYLAFFCTFRYGRPYLTSAAETFWLNAPLFAVLLHWLAPQREEQRQLQSRAIGALFPSWVWVLAFGVAWGLGAAYKSFALIVPAAAALWCALLWLQVNGGARWAWPLFWTLSLRVGSSALIGLGIFALWFAIDPDPAAVWREFIMGENAGKMNNPDGYWRTALVGGSSIWVQALAYLQNAGLMAFAVLGLLALGAQQLWFKLRHAADSTHAPALARSTATLATNTQQLAIHALIVSTLVWWLVFAIPSQRSARYVIPAMPALACLLALYGHRIHRVWLLLSLVLTVVALLVLTRLAWVMEAVGASTPGLLIGSSCIAVCGLGVMALGLLRKPWTLWAVPAACIAVFASLNTLLAALDGPAGRFDTAAAQQLRGLRIAVPSGFNGSFERYSFVLPGNTWLPYNPSGPATLDSLLANHASVVWSSNLSQDTKSPCEAAQCRILAERWDFRSRHAAGEVRLDNLWDAQQWLLKKEWLLQRSNASTL
jgi:4-amino-4-deoxy-L-arabinose transferase-like glycosyltransferase